MLCAHVCAGGLLFFGGPVGGADQLVYNAHRVYGPVRLPMLTANWEVVGVYDHKNSGSLCGKATCEDIFLRWQQQVPLGTVFQPVIVVRNQRPSSCDIAPRLSLDQGAGLLRGRG